MALTIIFLMFGEYIFSFSSTSDFRYNPVIISKIQSARIDLFNKCLNFLDARVELDQKGFKEDIFEH